MKRENNTTYYVYEMIDPRTNNVFYIGKGTFKPGRSYRWVTHIRNGKQWYPGKRVTNTMMLKQIHEILCDGYSPICNIVFETKKEENTLLVEKQLIIKHGRIIDNTGTLTNLIEGGSGFRNYKEQISIIRRLRSTGSNNGMYGKHHTEETKQKIRETRFKLYGKKLQSNVLNKTPKATKSSTVNKIQSPRLPYRHTEEHKQKLREHNPGGEATAKPIYQIDALTGEVIKEWKSTRQAGIELNITTWRNISTTTNHQPHQTVGGFYWRWIDDENVIDNKLTNIVELNAVRLNPSKRAGKRVEQIDENGEVVKEWNSMCEAAKHFGWSNATILSAIKRNKQCGGYWWRKC